MLLAYLHPYGTKNEVARLCILADKIDTMSIPVPVESLPVTVGGVYRLGLYESCTVNKEEDGALLIRPVLPTQVYITPNQPDRPGTIVGRLKIYIEGDGIYKTFFAFDKDPEGTWKPFDPLKQA